MLELIFLRTIRTFHLGKRLKRNLVWINSKWILTFYEFSWVVIWMYDYLLFSPDGFSGCLIFFFFVGSFAQAVKKTAYVFKITLSDILNCWSCSLNWFVWVTCEFIFYSNVTFQLTFICFLIDSVVLVKVNVLRLNHQDNPLWTIESTIV